MSTFIKEYKDIADVVCEVVGLEITNHPAVVKLIDLTYDSESNIAHIKLPKLDPIVGKQFSFNDSLQIIYDIASAMHYLRINGVMHRDIKEHNVMTTVIDGRIRGVLIDFNLCTFIVGSLFLKPCSTITHRAPEVAGALFDSSADVWSLGFVIYSLVVESWKDVAYDNGWFTGEYDEKEWIDFVTNPKTLKRITQTITNCDNGMTEDEHQFLIRLIKGCLLTAEFRVKETDIMLSIERFYSDKIVKIDNLPRLVKRLSPTINDGIILSDRCIGLIKMHVSHVREHIYGVLNYVIPLNVLNEQLIYTLIYSLIFMYDNNEVNIWDFPTVSDFVVLHGVIKWRIILFV